MAGVEVAAELVDTWRQQRMAERAHELGVAPGCSSRCTVLEEVWLKPPSVRFSFSLPLAPQRREHGSGERGVSNDM